MKSRRLIINGDDFGRSREINEAVIFAYRRGILTSTSLMVSGDAFEHAVALAKENPGLAVGLHVTCVMGRPVLSPSEIPHLVEKDGNLPGDPGRAGLRYFFSRNARKEIFDEISAQFAKFSRSGLNFSHVDSHCHLHVHPVVLDAVVEISEKYRINRIRVPEDSFFSALPFLRSAFFRDPCYALVFKLLAGRMKQKLRKRGFVFPKRVYGNMMTGRISLEYVLSLLDDLPDGVSEIYFHPSFPCSPPTGDPEEAQRFRELSILIDPQVRSAMDCRGIDSATYFDLENDL